jgi:hypothetical protein
MAGHTLFLTRDEAVFVLHKTSRRQASAPDGGRQYAIRLRFEGSDRVARLTPGKPLGGVTSYIRGNDPAKWRVGVPGFGEVRYEETYPGVDTVFYGGDTGLEYDFVVAPHADASRIRLRFEGVDSLSLTPSGDLSLSTPLGELFQRAPGVYQETRAGRRNVAARYTLLGSGELGFELGAYDAAEPLVIDPVLVFSSLLGDGIGSDIVVDPAGRALIAGGAFSAQFPTVDPIQPYAGSDDAIVTKLDPSGNSLVYSTFIGGASQDGATCMALDPAGNVYIAGYTYSTDFPTVTPIQGSRMGPSDVFVAKISASGSALSYSTYLGGTGSGLEHANSIAVDGSGSAYVTGLTSSTNFPTLNPIQTDPDPLLEDAFVTKLNGTGTQLVYSTYLGGIDDPDEGNGIAVDSSGSAYVVGRASPGFPTTPGAFQESGGFDAFVAKLNPAGNGLVFSTHLGGVNSTVGYAIAIDSSGNSYVTGRTSSLSFPTTPNAALSGTTGAFATKLNPTGSALVYSTLVCGADRGLDIALDPFGNAYVVCWTFGLHLSLVHPLQAFFGSNQQDGLDGFIAKVNTDGSRFLYSTYLRGRDEDAIYGVAVDDSGNAFVTGFTGGDGFLVSGTLLPGISSGAFVSKINDRVPQSSAGIYVPTSGAWFLRNSNSPGPADMTFGFGPAASGLIPLAGDWDGNATVTPGLYDPATGAFFLDNANAPGPADIAFAFGPGGNAGYVPIVGDWNGDGIDTVGLYFPATGAVFLKNAHSPGPADVTFGYGPAGDLGWRPISGDWNADGIDTIGLYDPTARAFFLKNENTNGPADVVFIYGPPGAAPIVGDWNHDSVDTVGVYVPTTGAWFLRDSNSPGPADTTFTYGPPGARALAGDWDSF